MGMAKISGTKGQMNEPNVVPFIDILLVLIIIFMVITPLTPRGLDALVPHHDERPLPEPNVRTIVIQMDCADSECLQVELRINQKPVTWESLGGELAIIFKERAERVAFVKAPDNLEFAEVARAIDIAKGAGVDQVGLMTSNPQAN
jgi:biopolymer transport protein ExbD